MKISYHWIKKYLDFNLSVTETSEVLTDIGLEVESTELYEPIKGGLEGVLVGKVLTCLKHPDADKLQVTKVDVGTSEPLQIVCGAPNVAEGQTVFVATVGAKLFFTDGNELLIKKAKIRGIPSEGMICSEDELGIGESHDGILVLPDTFNVGEKASELFFTENDTVFEIGLTPNRSDAMSHYGVARDLAAALSLRKKDSFIAKLPDVSGFNPEIKKNPINIVIDDAENCPRYAGVFFKNIKVGESPEWLKSFIKSMGMKPVNNIVDISNFVMLETGQPLHAFDAKKIIGNKIVVRKSKSNEFVTLDEINRKMNGHELMICNENEEMCMAGVFGGLDSGVTMKTTSIFLESAYFNPVSVRKSAKFHGLKTDSSFRFERGVDPEMIPYALHRAALLISELCPEVKYSTVQDVYPAPIQRVNISCSFNKINELIGKEIPSEVVISILKSLDFEIFNFDEHGFETLAPLYRVDVTREADVIEEVLRIYGFNSIEIPETLNYSLMFSDKVNLKKEGLKETVSSYLSSNGFYEAMNNSLSKSEYIEKFDIIKAEDVVKILNPLSKDLEIMRQSLLPGLLENVLLNQNYHQSDIRLFEFGKEYRHNSLFNNLEVNKQYNEKEVLALVLTGNEKPENWKYSPGKIDFFTIKSYVEKMIQLAGLTRKLTVKQFSNNTFKDGIQYLDTANNVIALCGILHLKVAKYFDIKQAVYYAEIRWKNFADLSVKKPVKYNNIINFQPVRRDLALLLSSHTTYDEVYEVASKTLGKIVNEINIFDVYEGDKLPEGKKSYAVSFVLQDNTKTMTEKDIVSAMDKLVKAYQNQLGGELR